MFHNVWPFLGGLGRLVEIPFTASENVSRADRYVESTTVEGARRVQVLPVAPRSWSVDVSGASAGELSGLEAFAQGAWGHGPWHWVSVAAQTGNLLSPQASGFEVTPANATDTGLVQLPDGTVARSVASSATVRPGDAHGTYEMVPVRPGAPVSVGAWSVGGEWFRGFWRDALGASITSWSSAAATWAGWRWHQVTLTPPAGAAFIELHLAGGTQYARPSISWGSSAVDRPGRGCPKAVVHGLSEALTVINTDDAYGSIDVTITEVG